MQEYSFERISGNEYGEHKVSKKNRQAFAVSSLELIKDCKYSEKHQFKRVVEILEKWRSIQSKHVAQLSNYSISEVSGLIDSEYSIRSVWEYAENSLENEIRRRIDLKVEFTEKELLGILLDMIEALKELHSVGIAHGNVRPSHILIVTDKNGFSLMKLLPNMIEMFEPFLTAQRKVISLGLPTYLSDEGQGLLKMKRGPWIKDEPKRDLEALAVIMKQMGGWRSKGLVRDILNEIDRGETINEWTWTSRMTSFNGIAGSEAIRHEMKKWDKNKSYQQDDSYHKQYASHRTRELMPRSLVFDEEDDYREYFLRNDNESNHSYTLAPRRSIEHVKEDASRDRSSSKKHLPKYSEVSTAAYKSSIPINLNQSMAMDHSPGDHTRTYQDESHNHSNASRPSAKRTDQSTDTEYSKGKTPRRKYITKVQVEDDKPMAIYDYRVSQLDDEALKILTNTEREEHAKEIVKYINTDQSNKYNNDFNRLSNHESSPVFISPSLLKHQSAIAPFSNNNHFDSFHS